MATTTDEFGDFYDERRAASDLKRYREKGPRPWTEMLIESLKAEGVEGATLLDIGGGVGVIDHELVGAGAASAHAWTHRPHTLRPQRLKASVAGTASA